MHHRHGEKKRVNMALRVVENLNEFELEILIEAAESFPLEESETKGYRLRTALDQLKSELAFRRESPLLPLDECPTPEQDYTKGLEPKEREAIQALLRLKRPFNLMLCGSPKDILLGLTKSLCQEAGQKAFVLKDESDNRFDVAVSKCAEEGSILVYSLTNNTLWPHDGTNRETLFQTSLEAGARFVLLCEDYIRQLPKERNWACFIAETRFEQYACASLVAQLSSVGQGNIPRRYLTSIEHSPSLNSLKLLPEIMEKLITEDADAVCTLIDMAMKAKSLRNTRKPVSEEIRWVSGDDYSLDLLNTTVDPKLVLDMTGVAKRKDGARILFSGPSGTGKTELAKYLAHELKVPLIQRRADELMHYKLGATERAIRDSFRQAYDEGAILFLDEFENLVQQRREGINASIIEMTTTTILAELDRYRGLFIACTNHLGAIDRAMLRRFTLKVNFMPLRPKDRAQAYNRYLSRFGGELSPSEQERLVRLEDLSLGDIGNILRRLELMSGIPGYETAEKSEVILMLAQEVALRCGKESPRIGFSA